jgi:hypothetical protein
VHIRVATDNPKPEMASFMPPGGEDFPNALPRTRGKKPHREIRRTLQLSELGLQPLHRMRVLVETSLRGAGREHLWLAGWSRRNRIASGARAHEPMRVCAFACVCMFPQPYRFRLVGHRVGQ